MADSTGKDLDDALKALEEQTIIANKFMEIGGCLILAHGRLFDLFYTDSAPTSV
jgi:hypothetical protein